jgi:hypothetical protein
MKYLLALALGVPRMLVLFWAIAGQASRPLNDRPESR